MRWMNLEPIKQSEVSQKEKEKYYILELTPRKDVFFIIGDWTAKVGSQETPRVTGKFGLGMRNEAGQRLIYNTREDSTYGHHQMVNTEIRLIIFFAAKDGEALKQSTKTRPGADCDSDHELLIAKFILKLKKKKSRENH